MILIRGCQNPVLYPDTLLYRIHPKPAHSLLLIALNIVSGQWWVQMLPRRPDHSCPKQLSTGAIQVKWDVTLPRDSSGSAWSAYPSPNWRRTWCSLCSGTANERNPLKHWREKQSVWLMTIRGCTNISRRGDVLLISSLWKICFALFQRCFTAD